MRDGADQKGSDAQWRRVGTGGQGRGTAHEAQLGRSVMSIGGRPGRLDDRATEERGQRCLDEGLDASSRCIDRMNIESTFLGPLRPYNPLLEHLWGNSCHSLGRTPYAGGSDALTAGRGGT